ncbi:emp24/gp25L/p24 family protein [Heterostelium album PN500]|uniref:Emp24/gp25L/p24 family protein n=1 Tax=Heterostelium pallidum (strain ATCC 26659 / Pp 5 / PN500) TaxID=670386 RepID=D3BM15_HETP5|nr:emp24/gp25L/p24 family protein [Heterostelium album PN500]EFA77616.1 emp24/gp25L/p24 family protein [Heterostelium album PN500]|eukprot:XP_020429744.1 emp24/gp25L/p24 family protein [Heterostelium album PN500]
MIRQTLLLAVVLCLAVVNVNALTMQIEPKTQECFYEYVENGKTSIILYQVIRGGLLDIDVRIYDPQGNTIFSRLHFDTTMKGRQSFTAATSGAYKLCFNNEMSRFTAKVVTFTWSFEDADNSFVKGDALSPMEQSVQKIERVLQSIVMEQKRMRFREQTNRDTSENTNARVVRWTIIQVLVLVSMGVGQIWYLRRWFDSKSTQRV